MKRQFVFYFLLGVMFVFCSQVSGNTYEHVFQKTSLLVSNYPEEVIEPGVVANDIILDNPLRLVYYHKNISDQDLFVNVQLKNTSEKFVTVHLLNAKAGPTKDGVFCGHIATKRFLTDLLNQKYTKVILSPHGTKVVSWHQMKPETISTGIIQMTTDSKRTVAVSMQIVDPEYPQLSFLNDSRQQDQFSFRYFNDCHKKIEETHRCQELLSEIPVGLGPFKRDIHYGLELKGHYGFSYDITVYLENQVPGLKQVNMYFSPIGGIARGVFVMGDELLETSAQSSLDNLEKMYEFILTPHELRRVRILTMPQPGSNYPVHLVLRTLRPRYALIAGAIKK